MKYCTHCGKEIDSQALVCPNCGCAVSNARVVQDSNSPWWGVLGFFLSAFVTPIVGVVLYCIWKKDTPQKAKQVGIGTLVATILGVVAIVLWSVLILGPLMAEAGSMSIMASAPVMLL